MPESLSEIVRERLLQGPRRITARELDDLIASSHDELVRLASPDPDQLVQLLLDPGLDGPENGGRFHAVAARLCQILDQLDEDGRRLHRLALAREAPDTVRWWGITLLGRRRAYALVQDLLPLLLAPDTSWSLRNALVEAALQLSLIDFLPAIRTLLQQIEGDPSRWEEQKGYPLVAFRLGDFTQVRRVIDLCYDDQTRHAKAAERALPLLLKFPYEHLLGFVSDVPPGTHEEQLQALLRADPDPAVRAWALERLAYLDREGTIPFCLEALGDPHPWVARAASGPLLFAHDLVWKQLEEIVKDPDRTPEHRLWAAYVRLLGEPDAHLPGFSEIPGRALETPGLPPAVRRAIATCWAPSSAPGTDVRWLLERIGKQVVGYSAEPLLAALRAGGFGPGEPTDHAAHPRGGWSNFQELPVTGATLWLSTAGPMVRAGGTQPPAAFEARLRRVAESTGWIWIDRALAEVPVRGLIADNQGLREEMRVGGLLFYWRDAD